MSTQMQEALDSFSRIANVLREYVADEDHAAVSRPLPDAERIARKLYARVHNRAGFLAVWIGFEDWFVEHMTAVLREEGVAE